MALNPNALTTLATAKAHIGISGNGDDTLIELYINAISNFIENWTGRKFLKDDYTVKLNGAGNSNRLYLNVSPIASVASVKIDNVLMPSLDYLAYNDEGYLHYSGNWPKGNQNIEVVYNGGYVLSGEGRNTPPELELATLKILGAVFNKREAEGASSSSSGGMNTNYASAMSDDVKALLRPYKLIYV